MATETVRGARRPVLSYSATDETKASLKTTEFWAAAGFIAAIFIAAWYSDSFDDVLAWPLATATVVGYLFSRGLAKSGSKYTGGEDLLGGGNPVRGVDGD